MIYIKLLLLFLGAIPGIWLMKSFCILFQIAGGKILGLKTNWVQIFNRKYSRGEDGKIKAVKTRFSVLPTCHVGPEPGQAMPKSLDILYVLLSFLLPSLIGLGFCTAGFILMSSNKDSISDIIHPLLTGFIVGLGSVAITSIVVVFFTVLRSGKSLTYYRNQKIREFYQVSDVSEIDFPPLETLGEYKSNKFEELSYQTTRFLWAEMKRDGVIMGDIARWLTDFETADTYTRTGNGVSAFHLELYRTLVIYYSTWCIDPERAKRYYRSVSSELEADNDQNGLRLRAYYQMNVMADKYEALKLAKEGLNKPDDPRFPKMLLDHEKKLLQELITFIGET